MSPDELKALGEDIKKNGLLELVVVMVNDDGKPIFLLDGRNRLDAMELVGKEFTFGGVAAHANPADPYSFVALANLHRRHLTAEQKRDLIAKLIKATPEKSDRQIAETVKASPTTVGTVRSEMEATGDVSKLDTRRDSKGRKQPAKKKRRTEDDFRRDLRAKKATAMPGDIGPMVSGLADEAPGASANPIVTAWDNASEAQRADFVNQRGDEVALPDFLRRRQ
jgi:hypothetical protein